MRVWILLVMFCGTALADDREDRETARKEFTAGQASDKRKDYQEAIEHYMHANDLIAHPFAMYNIAVDFERLGKLREAANWYERYLDNAGTKEADRERVNRLLIDLRNRPSKITVITNPDGARVVINGIPSGTTPFRSELKGGMYRIAIEKGDERDFKEVTAEFGEPIDVQFTLSNAVTTPATTPPVTRPAVEIRKPPPPRGASGVLVVRGEPYGALISVDDVPIGTLPMQTPLEVGTHTVKITADGFSPFEQEISIIPSGQTPVDARLSRALGTIEPPPGRSVRVGYLLGGGGGADARGNGTMYLVEAGLRASRYDLSARVGRLIDVTVVDLLVRWTLMKTRIAPYVGGGYSYVSNGYGYTLFGGLRFDITDGEKFGLSLMAESGFRFYSGSPTVSSGSDTNETSSGSIVPIMASLLITYR